MSTWYKEGLRFECTGCGKCCTGGPGYAWVTPEEIENIAKYLDMPVNDFVKKYCRKVQGRWSLTEIKPEYSCVFLKEKRCTIYPVRPTQCRTFPWWKENLSSPEAWAEAAKSCEGIRDDAPVVAFGKIQESFIQDT